MKLYVHLKATDGETSEESTTVVKVEDEEATVADILRVFAERHSEKHGHLDPSSLRCVLQDGRVARGTALAAEVLEDGADVTVVATGPHKGAAAKPPGPLPPNDRHTHGTQAAGAQGPAGAAKPSLGPHATSSSDPKAQGSAAMGPNIPKLTGDTATLKRLIVPLLKTADANFERGNRRAAANIYRQVFDIDPQNAAASLGMARIAYANKIWSEAYRYLRTAATGRPHSGKTDDDEEVLQASAHNERVGAGVLYLMGRTLAALMKHVLAVRYYLAARRVWAYGCSAQDRVDVKVTEDDIDVALGAARFEIGDMEEAADVINEVISRNPKHLPAIVACARLTRRVGKLDDSLSYLLQGVVLQQHDKDLRKELARALGTPGGPSRLFQTVPPSPSSAAAYAFLATVAKDGGAIDAAVALYVEAVMQMPSSASYALNLAHVYEIREEYEAAVETITAFLTRNESLRVGRGGLRCGDVAALLADRASACADDLEVTWVPGDDSYADFGAHNSAPVAAEAFDSDSLDLLALLFTLTKVMYLQGRLRFLPRLVRLVEPTRRASSTKLHQTTVRNEHAYYCCIAQHLTTPGPRNPEADAPPIYVCGDSHALSPAWMVIDVNGQQRLLRPALVTGLKHWHLRPESEFYPKKNFQSVVGNIPAGSDVVFLFGEIDCREGLLVAVEKGKYQSLEDGMATTINIFISAALDLVRRKKFTAYIHPIVPVLNETRSVVTAYNTMFKAAIEKTKGKLRWLDFFDHMLTSDGKWLRKDLELDGTHLHPMYLSDLLAPSIEKACQA